MTENTKKIVFRWRSENTGNSPWWAFYDDGTAEQIDRDPFVGLSSLQHGNWKWDELAGQVLYASADGKTFNYTNTSVTEAYISQGVALAIIEVD